MNIVPGDRVCITGEDGKFYTVINVDDNGFVQLDNHRFYLPSKLALMPELPGMPEAQESQHKTSGYYLAILHELGYQFRLSKMDDAVMVANTGQWAFPERPMSDLLEDTIFTEMEDRGEKDLDRIRRVIHTHAGDNAFHPLEEYFSRLSWNGQDNILTLTGYLKTDNTEDADNLYLFLRRWCIGAIAKALTGTRNPMLVLDGPQEIGKSSLAAWLCSGLPEFFISKGVYPHEKDDMLNLIRHFIWEVPEIDSTTRRTDASALKAFLSLERVTVRPPFGRREIKKTACASFVGTFNNEYGFLTDTTGSSRFLTVKITGIDWQGYVKNVDPNQVWAQAWHYFNLGESWRLDDDEKRRRAKSNERYNVADPLQDLLTLRYEIDLQHPEWTLATSQILDDLHTTGWRLNSPTAESMAVAKFLRAAGLEKSLVYQNGVRVNGYTCLRKRCGADGTV